jgi:hypothetical protein
MGVPIATYFIGTDRELTLARQLLDARLHKLLTVSPSAKRSDSDTHWQEESKYDGRSSALCT